MSDQSKQLRKVIDLTEERFTKVAPPAISYEAEKGFAIQVLSNNSYLAKVAMENQESLAQAITNVAAIGLSLNPAEKQAYLIPRNVKQGDAWVSKVFLEPSYMGLCKLATDSGAIEWVQAQVVYANDTFVDNGVGEKPTHTYNAFAKDRGEFVGVYCVAKTHNGDFLTTIMPADEVYSIRDRSEAWKRGKSGPWKTDFNEQAKKTVVRRAFKMWPRSVASDRMAQAVHLSNENEGFEPIINNPNIMDFTAEQKRYYDQLIEQNNALGMYVFLQTVEESVRNNLYHSFEKGTKGKFQQIVDSLYGNGEAQFRDYIDSMNDVAAMNDAGGFIELADELTTDALNLMRTRLSREAQVMLDEMSSPGEGE